MVTEGKEKKFLLLGSTFVSMCQCNLSEAFFLLIITPSLYRFFVYFVHVTKFSANISSTFRRVGSPNHFSFLRSSDLRSTFSFFLFQPPFFSIRFLTSTTGKSGLTRMVTNANRVSRTSPKSGGRSHSRLNDQSEGPFDRRGCPSRHLIFQQQSLPEQPISGAPSRSSVGIHGFHITQRAPRLRPRLY